MHKFDNDYEPAFIDTNISPFVVVVYLPVDPIGIYFSKHKWCIIR